jgi:RNA polymerase sigma-70 factor (ECF subfamily)
VEKSDGELIRESRRGGKEAFQELVRRYQKRVMAVALGMVHNPDDAMEITQDTFVKAFENIDRFKGESSVYTWLYRIVVNRAIDFRRRERRHPVVRFDDRPGGDDRREPFEDGLKEEHPHDPFDAVQAHEVGDRVTEAINELTPDHKAVILLREVEGLSYDEISRVMQCSKGTVMSRLHYARKKLQKQLKDLL